jgi:hypothetical protein
MIDRRTPMPHALPDPLSPLGIATMNKDMGSSPQLEVFNRLLQDRIVVLGSEVEDTWRT